MNELTGKIRENIYQLFIKDHKQTARFLISLISLSAVFKLTLLIVNSHTWVKIDSIGYITMAEKILEGKPISAFPNGYPLILLILMWLFGDHFLISAVLFSFILSVFSTILVFYIVKEISGSNAGLFAATLTSFFPNQIFYANDVLTEVPSTFFLLAAFLSFFRQKALLSGLLIGIAVWIRTSFLPILLILPISVLALNSERVKFALMFFTGVGIVFSADLILTSSGITAASSNFSVNLLLSINKRSYDSTFFADNRFTEDQILNPLKHYLSFAAENPKEFIIQRMASVWEMWFYSLKDSEGSVVLKIIKLIKTPFFLFSVYAVTKCFRDKYVRLLFVPVFFLTLVHFLFFGEERFSFYAEPFTIMITVYVLHKYFQDQIKKYSHER